MILRGFRNTKNSVFDLFEKCFFNQLVCYIVMLGLHSEIIKFERYLQKYSKII